MILIIFPNWLAWNFYWRTNSWRRLLRLMSTSVFMSFRIELTMRYVARMLVYFAWAEFWRACEHSVVTVPSYFFRS